MFEHTRNKYMLPRDLEFQNRAFEPNRVIPRNLSIIQQVNTDDFLRQQITKDPKGFNLYEFRDYGHVIPLQFEWQQGDYRPLHMQIHTRRPPEIKNMSLF
jgi:acetoacetate decarboxylase